MNKTEKKEMLFAFAFLLLIIGSVGLSPQKLPSQTNNPIDGKVQTTLIIDVFNSQGLLKSHYLKNDDLILDNYRYFWGAVFTGNVSPVDAALVDDGGNNRSVRVHVAGVNTNTVADSGSGTGNKGGYIGIGTGTTAPARTDYSLETQVESYTAPTAGYPTWDSASGNVTISASIPITNTRTITEACLSARWVDTSGSVYYFTMFRDTWAGTSTVSGDTMVITYIHQLTTTSFTNNMGLLMQGIFTNVANAGSLQLSGFKTINNAAFTLRIYYNVASSNAWTTYSGANHFSDSRIGTGTTAVARTQYELTTPVDLMTIPSIISYGATTYIIQSDIACASNRAVTEYALYIGITTTTPSAQTMMLIRYTFAAVNVPSGQAFRGIATVTC